MPTTPPPSAASTSSLQVPALPAVLPADVDVEALYPLADTVLAPRLTGLGPKVRDLSPALWMAERLGVRLPALPFPVVTVVGSKGKGTTTIAASSVLASAGLRVGTVTSPSLVDRVERIRLDGAAVSHRTFVELACDLAQVWREMDAQHPDWCVPHLGGMHFLAGLAHFVRSGVDVAVLEASKGGARDEVSLARNDVVVLTPVFAEHLGQLGDTVAEIAIEKLGVITPSTRVLVTAPQTPDVQAVIADVLEANPQLEHVTAFPVPTMRTRADVVAVNLEVGAAAAHAALRLARRAVPDLDATAAALDRLALAGRASMHAGPNGPVMVDCGIDAVGVRAALTAYRAATGQDPRTVLMCLPWDENTPGVLEVLAGLDVTAVECGPGTYTGDVGREEYTRRGVPVAAWEELAWDAIPAPLLALGRTRFSGAVLSALGEDLTYAW